MIRDTVIRKLNEIVGNPERDPEEGHYLRYSAAGWSVICKERNIKVTLGNATFWTTYDRIHDVLEIRRWGDDAMYSFVRIHSRDVDGKFQGFCELPLRLEANK